MTGPSNAERDPIEVARLRLIDERIASIEVRRAYLLEAIDAVRRPGSYTRMNEAEFAALTCERRGLLRQREQLGSGH